MNLSNGSEGMLKGWESAALIGGHLSKILFLSMDAYISSVPELNCRLYINPSHTRRSS